MRTLARWLAAIAVVAISAASAQTYRDSNGTIVQGEAPSGSTGADFSANRPALPNIGANFGASGPYANYVLIGTIAANPARIAIDVENTSGAQIAILLDDGTASAGAAGANATVFALSGGSGPGAQGGSWVSEREKGRVQIYAPSSSAQVAMRQN